MEEIQFAQIDLLPSADGGLRTPMPLPTTSLLLVFNSLNTDSPGEVQIGAHLSAAGRGSIAPGDSFLGTVDFWADLGHIYATPGATFKLWYAGRVVGTGRFESEVGVDPT